MMKIMMMLSLAYCLKEFVCFSKHFDYIHISNQSVYFGIGYKWSPLYILMVFCICEKDKMTLNSPKNVQNQTLFNRLQRCVYLLSLTHS